MADNVSLTPGTGVTFATDDVGGVHIQRIKRSVGQDGFAIDFLDRATRSDTYTVVANGTPVDFSAQGMASFALQCVQTGTVTSWNIVLEVSLTGTNWQIVLRHKKVADGTEGPETAIGDGALSFTGAARFPALYMRSRCEEITLGGGTSVAAFIVALP
jgi:hypothetical protein